MQKETTLADVERLSGPHERIPRWGRYVVLRVSGWPIKVGQIDSSSHVGATFSVLDVPNCAREVARFSSANIGIERAEKRARDLARRLNEQEYEPRRRRKTRVP